MPASSDDAAGVVADIWRRARVDCLLVLARHAHDLNTAPAWAVVALDRLPAVKARVAAILRQATTDSVLALHEVLALAWAESTVAVDMVLGTAGSSPRGDSAARAVTALAVETARAISAVGPHALADVEKTWRRIVAVETGPVLAGTRTRRQAAAAVLDDATARGLTGLVDRSGRRWPVDSYVEMATRAARVNAHATGTAARLLDRGIPLAIVSDHGGECPTCRPWEGKVVLLSGTVPPDGVTVAGTLAQARADGLFHPGCRHTIAAYLPGITTAPTVTADPAGWEARQRQRALERRLRDAKDRTKVATAAGDRALASRQRARANATREALDAHVAEHGLYRKARRERTGAR